MHSEDVDVATEAGRHVLVASALFGRPTSEDLRQAVGIVRHRLSSTITPLEYKNLLCVLVEFLQQALGVSLSQVEELARAIWRLPSIQTHARQVLDHAVLPGMLL